MASPPENQPANPLDLATLIHVGETGTLGSSGRRNIALQM
jgi:hypothetical protein